MTRRVSRAGWGTAEGGVDARFATKTAGYKTYFTGKWHLGEADYALPNAHGYDQMKSMGIYHLNAYTYGPDLVPRYAGRTTRDV